MFGSKIIGGQSKIKHVILLNIEHDKRHPPPTFRAFSGVFYLWQG